MCGYLWIYLWIPKHIPYHIYLKFILQICVYCRSLEPIGPNTLYLKVRLDNLTKKSLHSDNCFVMSDQNKLSDLEFTRKKKIIRRFCLYYFQEHQITRYLKTCKISYCWSVFVKNRASFFLSIYRTPIPCTKPKK